MEDIGGSGVAYKLLISGDCYVHMVIGCTFGYTAL
jgi:hypothetical protein